MFKLALSETFWAKCKVEFTGADGKKQTGAFDVQYKRHDLDDMQSTLARGFLPGGNPDPEFLKEEIVGFREIEVDDNGTIIKADETEAMLGYLVRMGFASALLQTFFAEAPRARAKN